MGGLGRWDGIWGWICFEYWYVYMLVCVCVLLYMVCQYVLDVQKSLDIPQFTRIIQLYKYTTYKMTNPNPSPTPLTLILLTLTLPLLLTITTCSQPQQLQVIGKVVQVEPIALDVILSVYDRSVVLFVDGVDTRVLAMFQEAVKGIVGGREAKFNRTIFAVCDIAKDLSGTLRKFGGKQAIQLITPVTHYFLQYPSNKQDLPNFFNVLFPQFLQQHTQSQPNHITRDQIQTPPYNNGFLLYMTASNEQQTRNFIQIHHKIFDYLKFFNSTFAINKVHQSHPGIQIFHNGSLYSTYASSAVSALLNFTSDPPKTEINDLIDFLNVETIPDVTFLDDSNYYRVFGSSIQYQILFVFREQYGGSQEIRRVLEEYGKAAAVNRNQGLKYQRVLFAVGTQQFLSNYFADNLLQTPQTKSTLLITKTDYSSFQLRKYTYPDPLHALTSQNILQFIQDVRLKKIDPNYKSEQVEQNEGKKIRKIVGNNFYHQVFQQPEKSVMVLFVDSKEEGSWGNIRLALGEFVDKYHQAYQKYMNVGIFDLAKNQHKALTISSAPELILFERSNKKKAKFFKGSATKQSIKNWLNYESKDFTIPQNFGQPPTALGGSQQNSQL